MDYQVDLDPTHQVLRITVTAAVITHEWAEDCYRSIERIASRGGPYAAIWDLSGVTDTTESPDDIRSWALCAPAVPGDRTRVVVATKPVIFGVYRMLELYRDSMGGQLRVVWSLTEAYAILGVGPEDFTKHLFPLDRAA